VVAAQSTKDCSKSMAKILVIEDEELVRANLVDLLELENFEVFEAENGKVGVSLAQQHLPDLILCDVAMPELDGYAVLEQLRQIPTTAGIPLIFLTARATPADFRQGMRLGADDYLTKPFTQAELLDAIATRLAKHAAITQPYTEALEQATAELNDHLNYDQVTRLPTRLLLQEKFNQLLAIYHLTEQLPSTSDASIVQSVPVLVLSIDHYNQICGNLNGSENSLFQVIAQRLQESLGQEDVVARLNEEQFAILLMSQPSGQATDATCQEILTRLNQPIHLNQQTISITASIGGSHYPQDSTELNTLMRKANLAMQDAQMRGKSQYQFYSNRLNRYDPDRLTLEASLRRALEQDEFLVYYQPQVDLQTGMVFGAEALLRWYNPERGMVSPAEFIPLAEETGLIHPIGEWVLHTACKQAQAWRKGGFSHLQIAVNLSGQQFGQAQLGQKVAQIVQSNQFDPSGLELELTESTLLQNQAGALNTLAELKDLGIQIAIDDFGTGYASLSYLKQFPFDALKIDRCFIRNVHSESYNKAITTAILQMANSLSLKVVAEGVETEAELTFLRNQQCQAIQGFLFSRPLPNSEFEQLLQSGKRLVV
jgi:diguanylate cyclase